MQSKPAVKPTQSSAGVNSTSASRNWPSAALSNEMFVMVKCFLYFTKGNHPSYAIILQIHTFNLPKIHENHPLYWHFLHLKVPKKIGDLFGTYHSKQGCALCVYIRLVAEQQIFTTYFEFFTITFFFEILSYFSTKINQLKIINLRGQD